VRSNLKTVCNLLYSDSCYRRYQCCICVLSSPWWSGLAEPWPSTVYFRLVKINDVYKAFSCVRTLYKTLPKWLLHVNHMWYALNEYTFFYSSFLHSLFYLFIHSFIYITRAPNKQPVMLRCLDSPSTRVARSSRARPWRSDGREPRGTWMARECVGILWTDWSVLPPRGRRSRMFHQSHSPPDKCTSRSLCGAVLKCKINKKFGRKKKVGCITYKTARAKWYRQIYFRPVTPSSQTQPELK